MCRLKIMRDREPVGRPLHTPSLPRCAWAPRGQGTDSGGIPQRIFRPRSGDPAFLSKPSDLAPKVIGFGLIPADDPNGPLIRAQDDLDQRPTPERCIVKRLN